MVENNYRSDMVSTEVRNNATITMDVIEGNSDVDDDDYMAFFLLATLKNLMAQFTTQ